MDIEKHRLSNMSIEKIKDRIMHGTDLIIEASVWAKGVVAVNFHDRLRVEHISSYGECIIFDENQAIPYDRIDKYFLYFLCNKSQKQEMCESITKFYDK